MPVKGKKERAIWSYNILILLCQPRWNYGGKPQARWSTLHLFPISLSFLIKYSCSSTQIAWGLSGNTSFWIKKEANLTLFYCLITEKSAFSIIGFVLILKIWSQRNMWQDIKALGLSNMHKFIVAFQGNMLLLPFFCIHGRPSVWSHDCHLIIRVPKYVSRT